MEVKKCPVLRLKPYLYRPQESGLMKELPAIEAVLKKTNINDSNSIHCLYTQIREFKTHLISIIWKGLETHLKEDESWNKLSDEFMEIIETMASEFGRMSTSPYSEFSKIQTAWNDIIEFANKKYPKENSKEKLGSGGFNGESSQRRKLGVAISQEKINKEIQLSETLSAQVIGSNSQGYLQPKEVLGAWDITKIGLEPMDETYSRVSRAFALGLKKNLEIRNSTIL